MVMSSVQGFDVWWYFEACGKVIHL